MIDEPDVIGNSENLPEQKKDRRPKQLKQYRYLNPLNTKQRKYLRLRADEINKKKSDKELMIAAGYAAGTPVKQTNTAIIKACQGNEELVRLLNESNLGLDSLVEDVKELRESTIIGKDGEPHPDNDVRFKTMVWRGDVLNVRPPKQINVNERRMSINISPETLMKIRELKGEEEFNKLTAIDETE